ncbi:hypothetical protein ATCC90586_002515 [Pythium insidiosum]|nr:hypothetical protein ATCC90586_002515 [Pythium insidiosum]
MMMMMAMAEAMARRQVIRRQHAGTASWLLGAPSRWMHCSRPVLAASDEDSSDAGSPAQHGTIRLAKLMAQRGMCSRREAETYIQGGVVLVNGERVKGDWMFVSPDADVKLDYPAQRHQRRKVSLVLNKPLGYVSSQPEGDLVPAVKLLTFENECRAMSKTRPKEPIEPFQLSKMAVCGRLDVNSTGLLLFTQDGTLAKTILDPNGGIEKEYLVRVSTTLDEALPAIQRRLEKLRHGVTSPDGITYRAKSVEVLNENQLRFILTEGKHRHIRRMCEHVGLDVVALKRVRIGNIKLGALPVGQWRYLQPTDRLGDAAPKGRRGVKK